MNTRQEFLTTVKKAITDAHTLLHEREGDGELTGQAALYHKELSRAFNIVLDGLRYDGSTCPHCRSDNHEGLSISSHSPDWGVASAYGYCSACHQYTQDSYIRLNVDLGPLDK